MNYALCIMNYCEGVPAIAVGLSAISFSASLQKDAAPIPNALGDGSSCFPLIICSIIEAGNENIYNFATQKRM